MAEGEGEEVLTPGTRLAYTLISVLLVLTAGLMSGLTLGLMSLDTVELEVLKRSGTPNERKYAARIMPVIANQHLLLVTLLLCNAGAMEALPVLLDRLVHPLAAIIISVTAVLAFGEIIPQALCSRYGLAIGAHCAWFVTALKTLVFPIAYPISKVLDTVLGTGHTALFRRSQLKALVDIHGSEQGLGGMLSGDEIKIITGALDLTSKSARRSMTPLDKVFMLSTDDVLDKDTIRRVLQSGVSRIPVCRAHNRTDIIGLILVKELLHYDAAQGVLVGNTRMRSLPRLPADTPMYDVLNLFQTGRSHMALLVASPGGGSGGNLARTSLPARTGNGAAGPHGEAKGSAGTSFASLLDGLRPKGGRNGDKGQAHDRHGDRYHDKYHDRDHSHHDRHGIHKDHAMSEYLEEQVYDVSDGVPVGIITIEDVIEELMQEEIVDETDQFIDNEQKIKVNAVMLSQGLPPRLRRVFWAGVTADFNVKYGGPAASGTGIGVGGGGGSFDLNRSSNFISSAGSSGPGQLMRNGSNRIGADRSGPDRGVFDRAGGLPGGSTGKLSRRHSDSDRQDTVLLINPAVNRDSAAGG